jgi:hypothetical protein
LGPQGVDLGPEVVVFDEVGLKRVRMKPGTRSTSSWRVVADERAWGAVDVTPPMMRTEEVVDRTDILLVVELEGKVGKTRCVRIFGEERCNCSIND